MTERVGTLDARARGKPELLAPAGDLEIVRVAVRNGADAVYFGARAFNARARATNLNDLEWREAVDFLHIHDCRAYLTLNTLLYDRELDEALRLAEQAYRAGVDALIVQDMGLVDALRRRLPDFRLFASTQMSLGNEPGLLAARQAGMSRVILPRERTAAEVERLTAYARAIGIETEVFIHGALCVSFSGQCLMSALQGGRSANRGACAQPCRLAYQLADARGAAGTTEASPRISLKDQCLYQHLAAMTAAGVTSLKIEGRLRSPAYVGAVVGAYRRALDGQPADADEARLLQAFNRGGSFTDAFWTGRRQPAMLSGAWPGNHGVAVGTVASADPRTGWLQADTGGAKARASALPQRKDVLSVRRGREEIASAPVGLIERHSGGWRVRGFHPEVLRRLQAGDRIYQMTDAAMERQVLAADVRKTPATLVLWQEGSRVFLRAAARQASAVASLDLPADRAFDARLTPDRVRQQLIKTGGTPFVAAQVQVEEPVSAISVSEVNALRREALALLARSLAASYHRDPGGWETTATSPAASADAADGASAAALWPGPSSVRPPVTGAGAQQQISVYYWQWPRDGHPACGADVYFIPARELLNAATGAARVRQLKRAQPDCQVYAVLPPDAVCCESLRAMIDPLERLRAGGLSGLASHNLEIHAQSGEWLRALEPGGNVTNTRAFRYHVAAGLARVAVSHEAESGDILAMLALPRGGCAAELTVYGRIGAMYTYTCPVAANACKDPLRTGVCLHRDFSLRDARQRHFPLLCHPGICTADILSAEPVVNSDLLRRVLDARPNAAPAQLSSPVAWRLYFYDEPATVRAGMVAALRALLLPPPVGEGGPEPAGWTEWERMLNGAKRAIKTKDKDVKTT